MACHFCTTFFIIYYIFRVFSFFVLSFIGRQYGGSVKDLFDAVAILNFISLGIQFIDFETEFKFVMGSEKKHKILIFLTFIKFMISQCHNQAHYVSNPIIYKTVYCYTLRDGFGNVIHQSTTTTTTNDQCCRMIISIIYFSILAIIVSFFQMLYMFVRFVIFIDDLIIYFKARRANNLENLRSLKEILNDRERIYREQQERNNQENNQVNNQENNQENNQIIVIRGNNQENNQIIVIRGNNQVNNNQVNNQENNQINNQLPPFEQGNYAQSNRVNNPINNNPNYTNNNYMSGFSYPQNHACNSNYLQTETQTNQNQNNLHPQLGVHNNLLKNNLSVEPETSIRETGEDQRLIGGKKEEFNLGNEKIGVAEVQRMYVSGGVQRNDVNINKIPNDKKGNEKAKEENERPNEEKKEEDLNAPEISSIEKDEVKKNAEVNHEKNDYSVKNKNQFNYEAAKAEDLSESIVDEGPKNKIRV